MAPSQDASDHQDEITFLGSGIPINLHFPLLLWGGHIQGIIIYFEFQNVLIGPTLCELTWYPKIQDL